MNTNTVIREIQQFKNNHSRAWPVLLGLNFFAAMLFIAAGQMALAGRIGLVIATVGLAGAIMAGTGFEVIRLFLIDQDTERTRLARAAEEGDHGSA